MNETHIWGIWTSLNNISPRIGALIWNIVIATALIVLILILKRIYSKTGKIINYLIALSVGILLGIVFLGFMPEIYANGAIEQMWAYILVGLLAFYVLETFLHFHHCRDLDDQNTSKHLHNNEILMWIWTLVHNMFHGIILFSAFSVSFDFGISMTLAIMLHSIPQNIANYMMNHKKAQFVLMAAAWWILGVLVLFPFTEFLVNYKWYILALMAWGLLYIALSDVLPGLKQEKYFTKKLIYLLFVLGGIGLSILVG